MHTSKLNEGMAQSIFKLYVEMKMDWIENV